MQLSCLQSCRYRAVVAGELRGCGRITIPLGGKPCTTEYRGVAVHASTAAACGHAVSTVDLWPHTGRTHQLRLHMALLGHAILGDALYWRRLPPQRQAGRVQQYAAQHVKLQQCELADLLGTTADAPGSAAAPGAAVTVADVSETAADASSTATDAPGVAADARVTSRAVSGSAAHVLANVADAISLAGAADDSVPAPQQAGQHAVAEGVAPGEYVVPAAKRLRHSVCDVGLPRNAQQDTQLFDVASQADGQPGAAATTALECTAHNTLNTAAAERQQGQNSLKYIEQSALQDAAACAPTAGEAVSGVEGAADGCSRQQQAHAKVMCLWALQVRFVHPACSQPVDVCIEPPAVFDEVLASHAPLSAA